MRTGTEKQYRNPVAVKDAVVRWPVTARRGFKHQRCSCLQGGSQQRICLLKSACSAHLQNAVTQPSHHVQVDHQRGQHFQLCQCIGQFCRAEGPFFLRSERRKNNIFAEFVTSRPSGQQPRRFHNGCDSRSVIIGSGVYGQGVRFKASRARSSRTQMIVVGT